jgi:hypothetical protein
VHAASVNFDASEHDPDLVHSPRDDELMPPRIAGSHALASVLYDEAKIRYDVRTALDVGGTSVNVMVVSVTLVTIGATGCSGAVSVCTVM